MTLHISVTKRGLVCLFKTGLNLCLFSHYVTISGVGLLHSTLYNGIFKMCVKVRKALPQELGFL